MPMTFLEIPFIPFCTNLMTLHHRILGSVFDIWTVCLLRISHSPSCISTQAPRAPDNGQPVAGQGRVQDPRRFDVVYQGVVDHHQPLGVSDSFICNQASI